MRPYRLMLVHLALGLAFMTGCGVGNDSGGPHGGGGTSAISTTAANFGVVGNIYFSTLSAKDLTPPVTWTVLGGVPLPDGLALTSATGAVTGTPTSAGNSTVTFRVTDSTGKTTTVSVLFAIHPRTDRVSVDSSGTAGDGASSTPSISSDGILVAFVSQSTNLVTGVNGSQVYIHNRQTNIIEVISRDSNAATVNDSSVTTVNEGDGVSSVPSISADGRFVAFVSQSTNLVTGVSGQQVYLRDRQTGLTTVVSKDTLGNVGNGVSSVPAISADGRYITFVSLATNLVTGVTGQQIYLHDRQTGQTTLVSKDNSPTPIQGNGVSNRPSISSDGRYIAFASVATNFVAGVGGNQEIYLHDRLTGVNGTTNLVSKDNSATPGNGNSSTPSISGNGRFVAFTSLATNLVTGVTGQQVYLHDRFGGVDGTNVLISHDNSGAPIQGNGNSSAPSISSDGQFVAFTSLSTNLLAPASAVAGPQIYIHDWLTGANGTTSLVSKDNSVTPVAGNFTSDQPSTGSGGAFVAFSSQATNLVAGSGSHIYVRALP